MQRSKLFKKSLGRYAKKFSSRTSGGRMVRHRIRGRGIKISKGSTKTNNVWYPMGKKKVVKLRYSEQVSINPAAGFAGDYVFSANSLFDPNVTGTGHQPYGFDQMSAFFNHYCVIGSKCTITAINGNASVPFYIAVALRDDATSLSGTLTSTLIEQPSFPKKLITPLAGSRSTGTARNVYSTKKFFACPNPLDNDDLNPGVGVSPTEQAYFHIICAPYNDSDDVGSTQIQVTIDYIAVFTGPAILPPS